MYIFINFWKLETENSILHIFSFFHKLSFEKSFFFFFLMYILDYKIIFLVLKR